MLTCPTCASQNEFYELCVSQAELSLNEAKFEIVVPFSATKDNDELMFVLVIYVSFTLSVGMERA